MPLEKSSIMALCIELEHIIHSMEAFSCAIDFDNILWLR